MEVIETISLREIEEARPRKIYYGANTCWWTHDPAHLGLTPATRPGEIQLPCDPRGGMLFETDNVKGFLAAARASREQYGRHGLRAFMAAHHLNCVRSLDDPRPWCEPSWDAYNDALDRHDARKSARGAVISTSLSPTFFGVAQPAVVNGAIHEFFLVALDRTTGDPIGGAPEPGGTAHLKVNLPPLGFVLSYVREVNAATFIRDLAADLARAFVADIYGRPEGGGEWALWAKGEQYVIAGGRPS